MSDATVLLGRDDVLVRCRAGLAGGGGVLLTVTVSNPGNRSATVGTAVSLQISAGDSASKPLRYSATGLPAGLAISSGGLITGTPTGPAAPPPRSPRAPAPPAEAPASAGPSPPPAAEAAAAPG